MITVFSNVETAGTINSGSIDIQNTDRLVVALNWTDNTPLPQIATSVSGSDIIIPNHGFLEGLTVRASSTGTLPSPLKPSTNYYVIVIDTNTIQLASTKSSAINLPYTPVSLTSSGSGTLTITPQALSGQISLTFSLDNSSFSLGDQIYNFSIGNGNTSFLIPIEFYNYCEVTVNVVSGQATFNALANALTVPVTPIPPNSNLQSIFDTVSNVPSNTLTQIQSYTVPTGNSALLQKVEASGTNIAQYNVLINNATQAVQYTFWGQLNTVFNFTAYGGAGLLLNAGTTVTVQVIHLRPYVGDFNSNIQIIQTPI